MKIRSSIIFILLTLLSFSQIKGEIIKGFVVDQDTIPVNRVIVQVIDEAGPIYYTSTSINGSYIVKVDSIKQGYTLRFSKYGYETLYLPITSDSIYNAILFPKSKDLDEIVVRAPHTRIKGDTIVYDVAALTSNADRNIGDIIRKIPGISIQDDIIYYDGEPINRFYIEGLNMLGGDYSIATNNINPNDVSSVSIYERHQPKKILTDLKMSDKAALNLKLKKNSLLRPIGYIQCGIGLNAENNLRYKGNLYGMLVSPCNQSLISVDLNNNGDLRPTSIQVQDFFSTSASSVMEKLPLGSADIASNRYYSNRSLNTEGSSLLKFSDDLTFSLRAMYGHENNSYSNTTTRRYLASSVEDIIYRDEGYSTLCNSGLSGEAKIEQNSNNIYLIDIVRFEGIAANNSYNILSNVNGVEMLKNKELSLTNNFNTIIKKGGNLFELNSDISYGLMPHYTMHYTVNTYQGQNLSQILSSKRLTGNVKGGYGYAFSNFLLGGELLYEFETELFKSIESDMENTTNNERGYNLTLALRPYIEWKRKNIRWRTELEGSYRNIRYKSVDTNRIFKLHKPYLDGSTKLHWKASAFLYLNATLGLRHTFGDIKNFIESPIYSSYRTQTILGNGELAKAISYRYSLNITYSNPLQGLICNGMAIYTDSRKNSLAASLINSDGDILTSNINEANKSKSIIWNLDFSKRFTGTGIVFKILTNGLSSNNKRIQQYKPIHVTTNVVNINTIGVANLFSDKLVINIDCGYSYSKQCIGAHLADSQICNFKEFCKLSWFAFPWLELYGGIDSRQSRMENGDYRKFIFLDGGCRYKKTKYEIELTGKNLANVSKYQYCTMLPLEIDTYSYNLRPLEIMLAFKWMF